MRSFKLYAVPTLHRRVTRLTLRKSKERSLLIASTARNVTQRYRRIARGGAMDGPEAFPASVEGCRTETGLRAPLHAPRNHQPSPTRRRTQVAARFEKANRVGRESRAAVRVGRHGIISSASSINYKYPGLIHADEFGFRSIVNYLKSNCSCFRGTKNQVGIAINYSFYSLE